MKKYLRIINYISLGSLSLILLPVIIICAFLARIKKNNVKNPKLVWGSTPLINNSYWSRAMAKKGFFSQTFTNTFYSVINDREDWDRVLMDEFRCVPIPAKPILAFIHSLFIYEVFFISYDGFFIGNTPICFLQAQILKIAGKKIVVIPYGSDAYVYRRIRSTSWIHGLMISYPQASKKQNSIARNVNYWNKHADAVIATGMGVDGIGRWDVIMPSSLALDLEEWSKSTRKSSANEKNQKVVVAHSPNHRGCKGTEFIISAVSDLQREGLPIEILLIEKKKNSEVRHILQNEVDILVEQLIFTGHGLSALEGMASGLPTISNLEDENYTLPMRRWSYLNECPLVSATPENIKDVLRKLVKRPKLRSHLGRASREYVEKYHGFDSAQFLFGNVLDYLYGRKDSLINLYHPILGDYVNRLPKIDHPLVKNQIVEE